MTIKYSENFTADTLTVYAIADNDDTIPESGLSLSGLPAGHTCAPGSTIVQPSTGKVWRADADGFHEII